MVSNVRDGKSGATVHPQYNLLNMLYPLCTQIYERVAKGEYASDIKEYMEQHNLSAEHVETQLCLIAELLDGLLSGKFEREEDVPYVIKAMKDCRWKERVDWKAMTAFDMMLSRGLLGYWFNAAADMFNQEDIRAQSPGRLTEIIEEMCKRAVDTHHALENK